MKVGEISPKKKAAPKKKKTVLKKKSRFKVWKWLLGFFGLIAALLLFAYISLGELRFFANNIGSLAMGEKNYLIILQNNYEVRPTGGFITAYGEVTFDNGLPSNISFNNSYTIDTDTYFEPPYPHELLLKNEWYQGYTFRDANWQPDFPTSAQELINFYQIKFPERKVDGIIVVNFSLIETLVGELGGIELNGTRIDENNLFKTLTDSVNDVDRHNEINLIERKSIVGELSGPLMSEMAQHPFKTKEIILNGLHNKDIYFWFADPQMQSKVEERGWANHMEIPEESDFLAVNLSNLGSKKADRYVVQDVYHHADLSHEVPVITTQVTLRYPGERNIYSDDYKGYLRLYVPMGANVTSELDETTQQIEKQEQVTVIGSTLTLVAGEVQTLSFTYELPRSLLNNNEYQLKIFKQSGTNKHYTLSVETGTELRTMSEDYIPLENKALWRGYLDNDMALALDILPDETPPYPVEQLFEDLQTINVFWSEAIDPSSGMQVENYKVVDLNHTDALVTDEIQVIAVEMFNDTMTQLQLSGVTEQQLERYQVILTGIEDRSQNTLSPSPKTVTAIQRFNEPVTANDKAMGL